MEFDKVFIIDLFRGVPSKTAQEFSACMVEIYMRRKSGYCMLRSQGQGMM